MRKFFYMGFIMLISLSLTSLNLQAQSSANGSTAKWFNGHTWLNGLKLKPHESIDQKEFARQYKINKAWWDKAFEFMKVTDLATLKPGKYPIDGDNVFALVTEGPNKDYDQTKWESHRHYNDIQYVIRGKEKIGVAAVASAKVITPYDDAKDIAFYSTTGKVYVADPGTFFIFSPLYTHRPSVKVEGYDTVKKLVVKVRTGK